MTVAIKVARAAANTSTGTQDFTTTDLGGLTPKAALFIATRAVTNNTAAAGGALCIGAATSATQRWALWSMSLDNVANTDESRTGMLDKCIAIPLATGLIDGEADLDSFITNGVRINWTNAPATGILIEVVLFAGDEVNAHADTYVPGTSVDGVVDVTAPNFPPDVLFLASQGGALGDTVGPPHILSFGFAVNDGSNTQRSILQTEAQAAAAGAPKARVSTLYGAAELTGGAGTLNWASEIGSFDSVGFSSTLRLASAGTDKVAYLAVEIGSYQAWVGTHDTPTGTGNQASTAPTFQPEFLMFGMTQAASVDAAITGADAGPFGITAITSTAQFSSAIALEDGAATINTQSLVRDIAADLDNDDGTAGIEATYSSFDTNGWTLNFTSVLAAARKWIALAIGPPTVFTLNVGGSITPTGTLTRQAQIVRGGSVPLAGVLVRQANKIYSGGITPSGALAKVPQTIYVGSIALTGTLVRVASKAVAGAIAFAGGLVKQVNTAYSGQLAPSGDPNLEVQTRFSGGITPTGALSNVKTAFLTAAGTIAPVGTLTRQANKLYAGTVGLAGTLIKQVNVTYSGSIASSGTLANVKTAFLSAAGSITPVGTFIKQVNKLVSGTVAMAGALVKQANTNYTGQITPAGNLIKQAQKVFAGNITPGGVLGNIKTALLSVSGLITPTGNLIKQVNKIVSGAITPLGGLIKQISVSYSGQITPLGNLLKVAQKATFSGSISLSGVLSNVLIPFVATARLIVSATDALTNFLALTDTSSNSSILGDDLSNNIILDDDN